MYNFNTKELIEGKPVCLDGEKEPTFYINTQDLKFIENINGLYKDLKDYLKKIEEKQKERENEEIEVDENGFPVKADLFIEEIKKEYDFILGKIDTVLGEGVTKKVFKGSYNQNLLAKFMEFIMEIIKEDRAELTNRYQKRKESKLKNKGVI